MPNEKNAELAALTRWRRDLHRIPELDFELPETTSYVRGVLGRPVLRGVGAVPRSALRVLRPRPA